MLYQEMNKQKMTHKSPEKKQQAIDVMYSSHVHEASLNGLTAKSRATVKKSVSYENAQSQYINEQRRSHSKTKLDHFSQKKEGQPLPTIKIVFELIVFNYFV